MKCEYCNQLGIEKRKVCIDQEPDGEAGILHPIYADVLLCLDHLMQYEQRTGVFDELKYGG